MKRTIHKSSPNLKLETCLSLKSVTGRQPTKWESRNSRVGVEWNIWVSCKEMAPRVSLLTSKLLQIWYGIIHPTSWSSMAETFNAFWIVIVGRHPKQRCSDTESFPCDEATIQPDSVVYNTPSYIASLIRDQEIYFVTIGISQSHLHLKLKFFAIPPVRKIPLNWQVCLKISTEHCRAGEISRNLS